jgi:ADP-heptose:LPS heptosyltransferase
MTKSNKKRSIACLPDSSSKVNNFPWLNIVGSLDASLVVSSLLLVALEKNPEVRFNLVRRSRDHEILAHHPAISCCGFPAPNSTVITIDNGELGCRPYQAIAQLLGVEPPEGEPVFLPGELQEIDFLNKSLAWGSHEIVVLATQADSPRKMLHPMGWQLIVERLAAKGILVVQIGAGNEVHIRGTYTVLGLLSLRQQLALIARANCLMTVDSFLARATRLTDTPSVVLWGPSDPDVSGYGDQVNLRAMMDCCTEVATCQELVRKGDPADYCPLQEKHCLNTIPIDFVVFSVLNAKRKRP